MAIVEDRSLRPRQYSTHGRAGLRGINPYVIELVVCVENSRLPVICTQCAHPVLCKEPAY